MPLASEACPYRDCSCVDSGALPPMNRWLSAPLLPQQVQTFLQPRVELQHARDAEQKRAVESLASLVAIRFVRGRELVVLQFVEERAALLQLLSGSFLF